MAAQAEWSALARLIAGRADVRLAVRREGRWQYPQTRQRPLAAELPGAPAAVLLYDRTGRLPVLVLDLDAKSASREQVRQDTEVACGLLTDCGLAPVVDEGPTGGRHVYCRLPAPVTKVELIPVAVWLKGMLPSLDTAPILNPIAGCIRPPGSPHTAGGYQRLLGDLSAATAALSATPPAAAWNRLLANIPADPDGVEADGVEADGVETNRVETNRVEAVPVDPKQAGAGSLGAGSLGAGSLGADPAGAPGHIRAKHRRPLPPWVHRQACNGPAAGQYPSASEARFAIICACRVAGWQFAEVVAALPDWPWLRASYGAKHRTALARDWRKTGALKAGKKTVRRIDTSQQNTQRGGYSEESIADIHLLIRRFTSHGRRVAASGRFNPAVRAVLDAMCRYGHMQARHYVNPGLRSLAEAAGVDHSTAGHALHFLADHGLIRRVGNARGIDADVWRLNVELGEGCRPARGRRIGLHRLFRVLGGHLVGEVYQVLTERSDPCSAVELAGLLGYSRSAVYEALDLLRAYHLAESGRDGWRVGAGNVDELSRTLGGEDHWRAQHNQHVKDRIAWHRRLDRGVQTRPMQERWALFQAEIAAVEPPDPLDADVGWTDQERHRRATLREEPVLQTPLELLISELGGTLVSTAWF